MTEIEKIAALLKSEAMEKQVAAAIVLGELKAKAPAVKKGLITLVQSGVGPLQRHALNALSRIGASSALDSIFPLLTTRDAEVREAAISAVASVGKGVIPKVRKRLAEASIAEKRALDSILAQLGGKEALSAILSGLHAMDLETAKGIALEVRQQIKNADAKTRRSYLSQIEKFLKLKGTLASPVAVATSLQIIGYLEEVKAVPTLLTFANAKKWATSVRLEAVTASRIARGSKVHAAKTANALLKIAETAEVELAKVALYTVGGFQLPAAAAVKLEKLASRPELDLARFAIEQLGRQEGAVATKALVSVVGKQDLVRAELATLALSGRADAASQLARLLGNIGDPARARLIQKALRPIASELTKAQRMQLLNDSVDCLAKGRSGWEAPLQVVRDADPSGTADALRGLIDKLAKSKKPEKAMLVARVLCRTDQATHEDRYRLASLEISGGRRDTHRASRTRDASLKTLERLSNDGFDVAKALGKDRRLNLEAKYYIGFHFAEEGHPLGEDLLAEVAKKGARTKIGKMAKNKLELAVRDA